MNPQRQATVPELLRERARKSPDRVALMAPQGSLTFGEWERRASAMSRGLRDVGAEHGDRFLVLVDAGRWVDYAVIVLGVQQIGAVAVPVSTRLTADQIERIVTHCGAKAVLCPPRLASSGFSCPAWDPDELVAGRDDSRLDAFAAEPGDLAEVVYTSGTTGGFKGVACTHENLTFLPAGVSLPEADGDARHGEMFLHWAPLGTNAAQGILHNLLRAGHMTAVTTQRYDPIEALETIARHDVAAVGFAPSMALLFVEAYEEGTWAVPSLRRITVTGAAASTALLQRLRTVFPSVELVNGYGLTEGGFAGLRMAWDPERPTAIGRAGQYVDLRLTDDQRIPVPAGESGELWLRAVGAPTRSYYLDAESTRSVWDESWVRTGDLAYLDDQGYVHLVDRKKDLIISGGVNISSLEIEDALLSHPGVRDAAVVGDPHPVLGEHPVAVVVLDGEVAAGDLQSHVRRSLGEPKTPHRILFAAELPRTITGKVRKDVVRDMFERTADQRTFVAPETATEKALQTMWRRLLDVEEIGVMDNFIEHGGHSVLAVQMLTRLRQELKVHVPLRAIFEAPTIRELAKVIDRAQARKTDWRHSRA